MVFNDHILEKDYDSLCVRAYNKITVLFTPILFVFGFNFFFNEFSFSWIFFHNNNKFIIKKNQIILYAIVLLFEFFKMKVFRISSL